MKYINKNRKQTNTQASRSIAGGEVEASARLAFGYVSNAGTQNGDFQHIYEVNASWCRPICCDGVDDQLKIDFDIGQKKNGSLVQAELGFDDTDDKVQIDGLTYYRNFGIFEVSLGDNHKYDDLSMIAKMYEGTETLNNVGSHNVYDNGAAGALSLRTCLGNNIHVALGVGGNDMDQWGDVLHFNIFYKNENNACLSYGYTNNQGVVYQAIHGLYKPNDAPAFSAGYEFGDNKTSWAVTANTEFDGRNINLGLGTAGSMASGNSKLQYEASIDTQICHDLSSTVYLWNKETDNKDQTGVAISFNYEQ